MATVSDDEIEAVRALVAAIPEGQVTTYGDLATAVGLSSPRIVGWIMRTDSADLPWHRVIAASGHLSLPADSPAGAEQRARLHAEGIDARSYTGWQVPVRTNDAYMKARIESIDGNRVKKDLDALKHLGLVKSTQQNWVIPGSNPELNKKGINHNVSVTVIVKEEEWDGVIDYLFENKEYFTAVSFIGASGDKDYVQAPNEEITTEDDEKMFNYYIDNYVPVDYSTLVEDKDETEFQQTLSCAGNNCEVPF